MQVGVELLNDFIHTHVWALLGAKLRHVQTFSTPERDLTPKTVAGQY